MQFIYLFYYFKHKLVHRNDITKQNMKKSYTKIAQKRKKIVKMQF